MVQVLEPLVNSCVPRTSIHHKRSFHICVKRIGLQERRMVVRWVEDNTNLGFSLSLSLSLKFDFDLRIHVCLGS